MILAIVDDLIFRGKLEAAAAHLGVPLTLSKDADAAPPDGQVWRRVLVDLNLSGRDALGVVRAVHQAHPDAPIIGYCSHVQEALRKSAIEAGCTEVVPRSVFVQRLPQWLA